METAEPVHTIQYIFVELFFKYYPQNSASLPMFCSFLDFQLKIFMFVLTPYILKILIVLPRYILKYVIR